MKLFRYSIATDPALVANTDMGWERSGLARAGSLYAIDADGLYWSSTSASNVNAYYLGFYDTGHLDSSNNGVRYRGFPIRS